MWLNTDRVIVLWGYHVMGYLMDASVCNAIVQTVTAGFVLRGCFIWNNSVALFASLLLHEGPLRQNWFGYFAI